jgi:hypothetical protein
MEIIKYARNEPHRQLITRFKGYPDGGVSILHYQKILPHHSMVLRSHVAKKLAAAGSGMGGQEEQT